MEYKKIVSGIRRRLIPSLFALFLMVPCLYGTAHAVDTDDFVFPVLGTNLTDPTANATEPEGWAISLKFGQSWTEKKKVGEKIIDVSHNGHLGQDYVKDSGCSTTTECCNATAGLPVYAIAKGEVVEVIRQPSTTWGVVVIIKHTLSTGFNTDNTILTGSPNKTYPKTVYSLYAHLKADSLTVNTGAKKIVAKGQQIGRIGTAGVDVQGWTCSHLHFEMRNTPEFIMGTTHGYSGKTGYAPNRYKPSEFINMNNTDKTLVKDTDGKIYWLQNRKKYYIIGPAILTDMQGVKGWSKTTNLNLALYPTKGPDFVSTGAASNRLLLREVGKAYPVYQIRDGMRYKIPSKGELLRLLGDVSRDIIDVPLISILNKFPDGQGQASRMPLGEIPATVSQTFTALYNANSALLGEATGQIRETTSLLTGIKGYYRTFVYGSIQYTAEGADAGKAFVVYGSFYEKWGETGFADSPLGLPTGNRTSTQSSFGTPGEYQTFEGGSIQLNTDQPFAVHGKVYAKWGAKNYAAGGLGFPTGDAVDDTSSFGTQGVYQRFEGGSILVIGENSYAVDGAIHRAWGMYDSPEQDIFSPGDAYEIGHLTWAGFPKSDAYDWNGKKKQDFEGGYVQSDGTTAEFVSTTYPENLTAAIQPDNSVLLNWQNRITQATGVYIYRREVSDKESGEMIASLGPNETSYTDTAAAEGAPYTYYIAAYNETAESPASNEALVNGGAAGETISGVIQLPKTGQTKCYNTAGTEVACAGTGQDGELQAGVAWPNPRFAAGTGTEADCMIDNLTGLMWPKNGNLPNGTKTWQGALDYVKSMNSGIGLCGYKDWRLPNIVELESMVNAGEANSSGWLNTQGFFNVQANNWSSTTFAYSTATAWYVYMWDGYVNYGNKSNGYYVWPVRAGSGGSFGNLAISLPKTGQTKCYNTAGTEIGCAGTGQDGELQTGVAWPNPRFAAGTGTEADCMIDNLTGLMWPKNGNLTNGTKTWANTLDSVANLNGGGGVCGHSDWRLPNVNELRSLVNSSQSDTAAWLNAQGFSNVQAHYYWLSTTDAGSTDYASKAITAFQRHFRPKLLTGLWDEECAGLLAALLLMV